MGLLCFNAAFICITPFKVFDNGNAAKTNVFKRMKYRLLGGVINPLTDGLEYRRITDRLTDAGSGFFKSRAGRTVGRSGWHRWFPYPLLSINYQVFLVLFFRLWF